MPFIRLLGNNVLSFFLKLATGLWHIHDFFNGYTAIRLSLYKGFYNKLANGYFSDTDVLFNVAYYGGKVLDVPIPAKYEDEKSNMSLFKVAMGFPLLIGIRMVKRIFFRYFLYDFNMGSVYLLLGIPMVLWGLGFGIYKWIEGDQLSQPNSAGTVMLSIVPLLLGIQFLLQAISIDISKNK